MSRAVLIALDSVEPNLLQAWMDTGRLPTLARMRERGAWATTGAPIALGNSVFWASMFTGVNAGKHSQYYYRQLRTGSYRIVPFVEDRHYTAAPLWDALSAEGRRCAVIDMVRSPLSNAINGVQICDWMTHDRNAPARSTPATFIGDTIREFGADPFAGSCERADRTRDDWALLYRGLLDRIRMRTRHTLALLRREPWDFFTTCFAEAHDVGHQAWHLHDPADPAHDADTAASLGDPLQVVYEALDAAVAQVVDAVGHDATVVVLGGPGMGPGFTANHLLDPILRRLEFGPEAPARSPYERVRAIGRRLLPANLRLRIGGTTEEAAEVVLVGDRRRRRFFAVPHNENAGAIRINLVGREPAGRVHPGPQLEAVCAELTRELGAIVNADTRQPIVDEVVRVRDHYFGPHVDSLPDLLVVWRRTSSMDVVRSPTIGELRGPKPGVRTGDHTPRGFVVACGAGVRPGRIERSVSPMDIGVTVLALLGVSRPNLDGTALPEVAS